MERISERETDVLTALGERLSNAQIASRFHISVRTVESHVSSLLRKYGVADRWELAELARAGVREPSRLAGLPSFATTFVGRDAERAAVAAAIEDVRLVTLQGHGGVGKTRLAAVAAAETITRFPTGGAFVDLVPVRAGLVTRAVATALGVTEGSHQELDEAVVARLGTGRFLLVLDNCEHVIDEVAEFVDRILAACPGVHVLVTSRERLGIPTEHGVPVGSLPLGSDAEQLFCERALSVDPGFVTDPALVAELCARLDGLPLAIELAAARGASLGPTGLLAALDDTLRLLSGGRGREKRHRSLHAVLSWSHDLLDDDEQMLFRRLGVFVGTFDIDAATAVGGNRARVADLLGRLVDKSFVVHVRGAVSRWRLLETVRAFAIAHLSAAGDEDKTQARHLRWAADAASALEARLDEQGWQEEFDAVAADLRAALAAPSGLHEETHRLASALAHLTFARRHLLESLAHHRTAAAVATSAAAAARALRAGAWCSHVATTSNQHVYELLLEAAEQSRRATDDRGRAIDLARAVETACRFPTAFESPVPRAALRDLLASVSPGPWSDPEVAACVALAHAWLAGPDHGVPDPELASTAVSAAEATGDPVLVSAALCAVATAALDAGRPGEAHRVTGERLQLLAAMDHNDPHCAPEICNTYGQACRFAIMTGDLRTAVAAALGGIDDDLLRDSHLTASRVVGPLALAGRFDDAIGHADRMWDQWQRAGHPAPLWMLPAVCTTVLSAAMLDKPSSVALWRARAVQVAADELSTMTESALGASPVAAFVDASLAVHQPDTQVDAEPLVRRAFAVDSPLDPYLAYARAAGAELAVIAQLPDAEALQAAAAPYAQQNAWANACLSRARGRLHHDRAELSRAVTAWDDLGAHAERDATEALLAQLDHGHSTLTDKVHTRGYRAGRR